MVGYQAGVVKISEHKHQSTNTCVTESDLEFSDNEDQMIVEMKRKEKEMLAKLQGFTGIIDKIHYGLGAMA